MAVSLNAPFPWFGGKRVIAPEVWAALGNVAHYIEPFFGSGAVLLQRPHAANVETVNDMDGMLCNFWRAVRADPQAVADHADWPVNEADLHARHLWLVGQRDRLTERLMGDAEYYEAQAAGWWVWGSCGWIGSGFCSGNGPWISLDGELVDRRHLPHLGDTGRGVNRKLPDLGDTGQGVNRKLPHLGNAGQGVNRKLPHLGDTGRGEARSAFIYDWFADLACRLRDTRVACGDWSRVVGPSITRVAGGITGVFLDPPYSSGEHSIQYAEGQADVAGDVSAWCAANGDNPNLRIVLAGYDGEHDALESQGWRVVAWKTLGGYGTQGENSRGRENSSRERLWLSPHCMGAAPDLFGSDAA